MRKFALVSLALLLVTAPTFSKETGGSNTGGWQQSRELQAEDPSKKEYPPGQEWVKYQDLAYYYFSIGKLRLAEEQCLAGIALGKQIEPGQLASLHGLLGMIYQQEGRFLVSIQTYKQAIELAKQDRKSDNVSIALRQLNLATALLANGDKQEAIDVLVKAKSKLKETDAGYGGLLQTLGKAYSDANQLADAESTLKQSVTVNLKEGPFNDPGTAAESLFSLCIVYEKQKRLDDALAVIERAIPLSEKAFGPTDKRMQKIIHEKVVLNSNSEWNKLFTAGLDAEQDGKIMEAIDKFNGALKIIEVKDPNSNLMALTVSSLGRSCAIAGENAKAEEMLTRAVPLYKRYYPDVLPGVEKMLNEVQARLH